MKVQWQVTLARITDPPKTDRETLQGLKALIQTNIESFAQAAEQWFPDDPKLRKENREYVQQEIPNIVSQISKFCNSPEVKRIHSIRKEAIAHRLRITTLRPTFNDIGYAFEQAHQIVSKASSVLTGTVWDPADFVRVQETYANEFWDTFQHGLKAKIESQA